MFVVITKVVEVYCFVLACTTNRNLLRLLVSRNESTLVFGFSHFQYFPVSKSASLFSYSEISGKAADASERGTPGFRFFYFLTNFRTLITV